MYVHMFFMVTENKFVRSFVQIIAESLTWT